MTISSQDVIIVGGGSAGCVVAARLSQDEGCRVLLLEAGPDYRTAELPTELLDGRHGPYTAGYDWGLRGRYDGRDVELPRGKVIGGCSATNGAFAVRGSPADYDRWGQPGWAWDDVLPRFRALEADADFGTESYHGANGPVPVRRYLGVEQSLVAAAATEALAATGMRRIADHNAPWAVGVSPLPVNTAAGRRISTAMAYLEPARDRPNLTVRGDATVWQLLVRGGRAVGVRLAGGADVFADQVIVAAGTYRTPVLLRQSGLDLPGVGANLIDHPAVSIDLPYFGPEIDVARYQLIATLHSSRSDPASDPPDLQILAGGPFPGAAPQDQPVFFVGAALLKPRSRGNVGDEIELNYYSEPDDLIRLAEGVERAEAAIASDALRLLCRGQRITPRHTGADLASWIRANTWSYHHPVGTCAMGSVVDGECRVNGVPGLYIVDASVMPDIPSANTNLPTIMIAERFAALRAGTPSPSGAEAR